MLFTATGASAQVNFAPIFTTLRLEARADFDCKSPLNNDTLNSQYGFRGRYFNLHIGGNLGDKFSYYFRQRIIANAGTVSLFDNTDFLYLNYIPNRNWTFRLGKDALAVGGFEYDASPIDVLFSTHYWDYFYCFQLGASVAYKSNDGNQMLLAQVANSPYVHYEGSGWQSGLLSYNLFWSGTFNHFRTLYSVNMFERSDGAYMNYIALGHKLVYDNWDVYVDLIHHSLAADDWGKNFALVSCFNYLVTPSLNIFAKGAYEQNLSEQYLPDSLGRIPSLDCLAEPGHKYLLYGVGFEYRPASCKAVRLHGFVTHRQTVAPNYVKEANVTPTNYVRQGDARESNLEFNLGVSWNMDVHKMLNDRLNKLMTSSI